MFTHDEPELPNTSIHTTLAMSGAYESKSRGQERMTKRAPTILHESKMQCTPLWSELSSGSRKSEATTCHNIVCDTVSRRRLAKQNTECCPGVESSLVQPRASNATHAENAENANVVSVPREAIELLAARAGRQNLHDRCSHARHLPQLRKHWPALKTQPLKRDYASGTGRMPEWTHRFPQWRYSTGCTP